MLNRIGKSREPEKIPCDGCKQMYLPGSMKKHPWTCNIYIADVECRHGLGDGYSVADAIGPGELI